jgi:lysyl-tRNA synthetase class 2
VSASDHHDHHERLRFRARLNALLRSFFAERGVVEVETPVLSVAGNTDPNIASFQLQFSGPISAGSRQRWLRTSPEFPLKRLLAEGFGDCYELGRVFRDGEAGGRHNPEFTMLEWYRVGWTHLQLIEETIALVQAARALAGKTAAPVRIIDFAGLYRETLGLDVHADSLESLQSALGEIQINGDGLTRDDWLDLLMTHRLQPSFDADAITVIHDYPASQSALARIRPGSPPVAERFELYLGPLELANGYHELNDAAEQAQRFERDLAVRNERGVLSPPIDKHLLQSLPQLPNCAGVAMGVDRLVMALLGTERIADVLVYDFSRA